MCGWDDLRIGHRRGAPSEISTYRSVRGTEAFDAGVREAVHRLMRTGTECAKTSERYAYGIRSTPTMIVNNRTIIGTLPYEQPRAIFQALLDEGARGGAGFLESRVDTGE